MTKHLCRTNSVRCSGLGVRRERPAKFVERVVHLLSPDDHKVPTANAHAIGTIPPPAPVRLTRP
jgi:hypothetical protein